MAPPPPPPPPLSPRPINLLRGWPSPSLLPSTSILTAATSALSNPDVASPGLLYGPDAGFEPLRVEVGRWMGKFYGYGAETDQDDGPATRNGSRICITGGASQALAGILQVFTDPVYTRAVWMVEPCYFLAGRVFRDAGLKMRAAREDEEGVDVLALRRGLEEMEKEEEGKEGREPLKPKTAWGKFYRHVIYAVPTFSNPSGMVMSLRRREELVRIARKYDALIITDDVYDMLQWKVGSSSSSTASESAPDSTTRPTALLPRIVDIDRIMPQDSPSSSTSSTSSSLTSSNHPFGNAVSNCSFSKICAPGMRTGWAEGTAAFAYGLSQAGTSRSGGSASQLCATFLAEMLRSGVLEKHVRETLLPAYASRYEVLMRAIERVLVPLGVSVKGGYGDGEGSKPQIAGGYFVWLRLPTGVSADRLSKVAEAQEYLVIAGGSLFAVQNGGLSISADGSRPKEEVEKAGGEAGDVEVAATLKKHPKADGDGAAGYLDQYVRLCFAWEDEDVLTEGVERLGRALRAVLDSDGRALR